MKTKKKRKVRQKYRPKIAIQIYQLASDGMKDADIARILKIKTITLRSWRSSYSLVRHAFEEGRKRSTEGGKDSVREYIYGRLSKKLKRIWDRIEDVGDNSNSIIRITKMFDKKGGDDTRKMVFLHALTESHFNPSEACKKTCIPYRHVKRWIEDDYNFALLVDEIQFHKKKLGETCLIKLMQAGDSAATIFFNRTLNKDLGYADKQEVNVKVEGSLSHSHSHTIEFSEEIMERLSKVARREVLKVMEQLDKEQEQEQNKQVLENSNGTPIKLLK